MNPKNPYATLEDAMVDHEMVINHQPPAYEPPVQQQRQQEHQQQQIQQQGGILSETQTQFQPMRPLPDISDYLMAGTPQVGPKPMVVTCPQCRARSKTTTRHSATAKTHIACILLSWTCCCCCLPYCMDSCRNTNHYCSMCDNFIGSYRS